MPSRILSCFGLVAVIAWLAWVPSALADEANVVLPSQVPACQACHGKEGVSTSPDIPNLSGQKRVYIVNQLRAFRSGKRQNDFMSAIATQLTDADIDALASFWSRQSHATASEGTVASTAALPTHVLLPPNFPRGFAIYQTESDEAAGKLTERYIDEASLASVRKGLAFPVGALLVTATRELQRDTSGKLMRDSKGQLVAGKIESYAAMGTGSGWGADVPSVLRNADWNYALFTADRVRVERFNHAACLACHKPAAAESFVFTLGQIKAFAMQN